MLLPKSALTGIATRRAADLSWNLVELKQYFRLAKAVSGIDPSQLIERGHRGNVAL